MTTIKKTLIFNYLVFCFFWGGGVGHHQIFLLYLFILCLYLFIRGGGLQSKIFNFSYLIFFFGGGSHHQTSLLLFICVFPVLFLRAPPTKKTNKNAFMGTTVETPAHLTGADICKEVWAENKTSAKNTTQTVCAFAPAFLCLGRTEKQTKRFSFQPQFFLG